MKILIPKQHLFTKAKSISVVGKIIQFPLVRIVIAIFFLLPTLLVHDLIYENFISGISTSTLGLILSYVEVVLICILLLYSFKMYARFIEKRFSLEVSTHNISRELRFGFFLGAGLICFLVLILAVSGSIRFHGFNSYSILIDRIFQYGIGSLIEELLFTLIIFKLVEEAFGSWAALLVNALIFGFAHIYNDNATIWSSFAIAISNPIIVVSFMITRRIWMSWAFHFSWNYFQAAIFNMPNSGIDHGGFLETTVSGPDWLTGGFFGIEASYVSVAVNFCVGLMLLSIAIKKKQLVKPLWLRVKN